MFVGKANKREGDASNEDKLPPYRIASSRTYYKIARTKAGALLDQFELVLLRSFLNTTFTLSTLTSSPAPLSAQHSISCVFLCNAHMHSYLDIRRHLSTVNVIFVEPFSTQIANRSQYSFIVEFQVTAFYVMRNVPKRKSEPLIKDQLTASKPHQ